MWEELAENKKAEYQRMILAFASLTEMFAQKSENEDSDRNVPPIVNSKYQETVFQRVFDANAEDIGNTSYDASLEAHGRDGLDKKYLIGIKTFGRSSGSQKVAQFKRNQGDWADAITEINNNSLNEDGTTKTKAEINRANAQLYRRIALRIAELRNMRIDSSESNLQGFSVLNGEDNVEAVYHVLLTYLDNNEPRISVGETSYTKIDTNNIEIKGCTTKSTPTNFVFHDGQHKYRFTSADNTLYMDFSSADIKDVWQVTYADDAYEIFAEIADRVNTQREAERIESYCWKINVERYSGFNAFYGVGSKIGTAERQHRIDSVINTYRGVINQECLTQIQECLELFLIRAPREEKEGVRNQTIDLLNAVGNEGFSADVKKLIFRPKGETYIPINKSREFHMAHPDFFAEGAGNMERTRKKWILTTPKRERCFTLVLEPSGEEIECFIAQDLGKAIESLGHQGVLGEWLLRRLFQLEEYEPLTQERLEELEINGIRLSKTNDGKIHLHFIWIDDDNLPEDYIQ